MSASRTLPLLLASLTALFSGAVPLPAAVDAGLPAGEPVILTNAAAVRELEPEQAAQRLPVRLSRAVVTFVLGGNACFVQDDTCGIFVWNRVELPMLKPGDVVELEGVSNPGEFAPVIMSARMGILEHNGLPPARLVTYDDLVSGREDSQWVEASGVVRAVFSELPVGGIMEMALGPGRLTAFVQSSTESNLAHLVESEVRVRGVCATWFNRQRQIFGFRLLVSGLEDIEVVEPGSVNSKEQPAQQIGSLLRFSPKASAYGRRAKVLATVTLQQPGRAVFVQDEWHGLLVQSRQSELLKPGDLVELLGFPVNGEYSPILQDAIWRKVVSGPEPEPVLVGPDDALSGAQDNRLVAIEGKLIERAHNFGETVLVLEAEGRVFSAYMDSPGDGSDLAALENNSRLRLTGVCRVEVGETWRAGPEWRAKSFRILLRGPADVMVLKLPPWRAVTRLLWAVGILVTAVLAALAWAAQLRQKVNKQTAIIRRQLEKEGALKNRYQDLFENANDMVYTHDLRGRMTSINVAGERLLGRKRDSIVQCCLLDFIAEEQRILAGQWFDQIVDGTAPPTVEWNFITASGGRIRLEISTRLIEREGRHVEVEGIARDVTERRRLEREILEISTREQRRIGHDLHDGVCQQLAGIGFLSDILADKLQEQNRPEAAEAQSIAELVNKANKQTRGVARGLFPVRLEENGLASALEELAESTGTFFNTPCELRCDSPVVIPDNTVAHHLYYIAQEAILNAIKHGNARRIEVQLTKSGDGGHLLSVRNDGAALALPSARNRGMGIRIMKYRARMIGATLQIDSPPGGGVEVACRFVSDAKLEDAPSAGRGEES